MLGIEAKKAQCISDILLASSASFCLCLNFIMQLQQDVSVQLFVWLIFQV